VNLHSFRFKLGLGHGLIISVAFLLIGLVRYQTVSYRIQQRFDALLLEDAKLLTENLHLGSGARLWRRSALTRERYLNLEQLRLYTVITDQSGAIERPQMLSRFMLDMEARGDLEPLRTKRSGYDSVVTAEGTALRFIHLPLPANEGQPLRIVHLGRPTGELQNNLTEYLSVWIYSVPLILITSAFVGWFLAGLALRPFEEVARTAEQITSKSLHTQIEVRYQEVEIRRLVQAFNAMVRRLERSFQQVSQFNEDAAHELRTPLSILMGETEVALSSNSLPEEVRSLLYSNLEELERLTAIVNDLLQLAQIDRGFEVLSLERLEVPPLVAELVDQVHLLALEQNVHIEVGPLPEVAIQGDALWLRRAFLNILDNAIKYSKPQGRIRILGTVVEDYVQLDFADDGIGISEDDLLWIFDRLFRADLARNRAVEGIGLGLSLVKSVIEAHSGRIEVETRLEQGTCFKLFLPLETAAVRLEAGAANQASSYPTGQPYGGAAYGAGAAGAAGRYSITGNKEVATGPPRGMS